MAIMARLSELQTQVEYDTFAQQAKLVMDKVTTSGLSSDVKTFFLEFINSATHLSSFSNHDSYLAEELTELYSSSAHFICRQTSKMPSIAFLILLSAILIFLSDFEKTSQEEEKETPQWKNPQLIRKIAGYAGLAFATVLIAKGYFDSLAFITESLSRAKLCVASAQKLLP